MDNFFLCFLMSILLISGICSADEIFLIDGSSAKTSIIDTNGCNIKIFRNNSEVTIRKKNVEKIIFGNDTILFTNFVCNETVRQAVNYNETAEFKLKVLIDSFIVDSHDIKDNSKMAYLTMPLEGNYSMGEFTAVQMSIIEILKQKMTASLITPDSMLLEFNRSKPQFDYVCITRKYHVFEIKIPNRIGGIKPNPADATTLLCTSCDFVIFDMAKKCIIFRHNTTEKQAEDIINKKQRLSDKNASSIRKDLLKALSEYFLLNQ